MGAFNFDHGGSTGQRLTISTRSAAMEKIVRSFQDKITTPPPARRTPVESDGDLAILTWGGEVDIDLGSGGFTVTNPGSSQGPTDQRQRQKKIYNEVSRTTNVVRVSNPNDAEDWVDVQRITSITFRGPDDIDIQFNLNN